MTPEIAYERKLYCSFCGKAAGEVRKLIAGPTVFICDECVALCQAIVTEEAGTSEAAPLTPPQDAAVRAIVAEMLGTMLEGTDERIRAAMAEADERAKIRLADLLDRTSGVAVDVHVNGDGNLTGFSRSPAETPVADQPEGSSR